MLSEYDSRVLSSQDQEKIKALTTQYDIAKAMGDTTGMNASRTGAESVRAGYGYSSGSNGNTVALNADQSNAKIGLQGATTQSDYINELYAAQQKQKLASLKSAYDANISDLSATEAKIPYTYNTARNSTAAASAINQSAFNERAAASGLNNGAGGQASLSMANTMQGSLSSLDKQQAQSVADIELQRSKLAVQYNSQIQAAMAENDQARAAALYNEAVRVDNSLVSTAQAQAQLDQQKQSAQTSQKKYADEQALSAAKARAAIGDYTGYQTLYGLSAEDAEKYYKLWALENPKEAAAIYS